MSDSEESDDDNINWMIAEYKKRKRKDQEFTREQIKEVIGSVSPTQITKKTKINPDQQNTSQETANTNNVNTHKKTSSTINRNFTTKIRDAYQELYKNLYYINTDENVNRIEIADIWEKEQPQNKDIILTTKMGFLLKSNTNKDKLKNTLEKLKNTKLILEYKETTPNTRKPNTPNQVTSYSAVLHNVEEYITDQQISEHLIKNEIEHRYCKRIIARATGKATSLIRIISGDIKTYEKIINHGLFYKNRHYRAFPSAPPKPAPIPCAKCLQFTHITENCNTPTSCNKCGESHITAKCKSNLPQKCTGCGAEDHQAWSFKCPKRPKSPIEGIPNIQIKGLNKKSHELAETTRNNSRIHTPITIHDSIVNTYIHQINKPKNINREELILKLRKRFIEEHGIDTCVVFPGGNRAFIFMFDMNDPQSASPTEAKQGEIMPAILNDP